MKHSVEFWDRYLEENYDDLKKMVFRSFPGNAQTADPDPAPKPGTISLPSLPVQIGTDLMQNQTARKILATWEKLPAKRRNGTVYRNSEGIWLLELGGFAEMIVISGQALAKTDPNAIRCENPLSETKTAAGILCACESGLSILRQDGKIREIWIVRK